MSILSIVLFVLKFIGIVLGIILLILLILLAIILFVPVKYSIYLSGVENIDMDIKITWFKKIVYYHYAIRNSKKRTKIFNFFGKSILSEEIVQKESATKDIEDEYKSLEHENYEREYIDYKKNDLFPDVREEESPKIIEHHKKEAKVVTSIKKEVKELGEDLSEELEEQVEEKDSFGIKDLLNYPYKKEIIIYTYEFLKNIILHIIPRKFYCEVEFGLEDPAQTGYVLAGVGIIQPYFGNSVNIKANFSKKIFMGEIQGKGKFLIGIIIKYIIKYLLKKPIKQIVKLYFKKRKEDKNGVEFEE